MGIEQEDLRSRGWFTNIKTTMDIELFNIVDEEERIYEIFTYDDHYYYPGVRLVIYNNAGLVVNSTITRIAGRRSFIVRTDSKLFSFQLGTVYKLQSEVLKTRSSKYPKLNDYITNVQNTYSKFSGETLVASNSIPSLLGQDAGALQISSPKTSNHNKLLEELVNHTQRVEIILLNLNSTMVFYSMESKF